MRRVITYLCTVMAGTLFLSVMHHFFAMPEWYKANLLFFRCILVGVIGGILYCLRAVYLNKCVQKEWDKDWEVWYYLRPITSGISGFASCIFLKAGLLVLEADPNPTSAVGG